MVSIKRVKGSNIDLAHGLTLEKQTEGAKIDYERRIIDLWNSGTLPHIIEKIMNISAVTLSAELKHYHSAGVNLHKKQVSNEQRAILLREGRLSFSREHSERDYQFYISRHPDFKITELAAVLGIPLSLLKSIINLLKNSLPVETKKQSIILRDKEICSEYQARCNERGIITKLSTKYNLSRRSIDIILVKAGLKNVKIKRPQKLTDKQLNIVKDYNESDFSQKEITPNSIMTKIGIVYNVSSSYVHKTLSQAGIIEVTKKRLTNEELEIRNDLITNKFKAMNPTKENLNSLALDHNIALSTLGKLLKKLELT